MCAGDCAIVSSFTSYLGPFNKEFRQLLVDRDLRSACARLDIPVTPDLNVATFLVDDAEVAEWTAQVRVCTVTLGVCGSSSPKSTNLGA